MGADTLSIERPIRLAFAAAIVGPLLACAPALAQSPQKTQPPAQARVQPKDATTAPPAATGGDAALRQRVEQLEEQLVDLQVVIGTLESLARSGVRAPAPSVGSSGPMSGNDEARLDSMETQIRALTAQIEQLSADVRAGAGRRSEAPGAASFADNGAGSGTEASTSTSRFGSTTVTSDQADPIGGLVAQDQMYPYGNQPQTPGQTSTGAAGGQPGGLAPAAPAPT